MKYQFNFAAKAMLLSVLLAASSCDVLTQDPPSAFSVNDAFSNADRIAQSAAGMYDGLQNAEFYGGRVLIYGDVRSDDTPFVAYFTGISDFSATSANGLASNAWYGGYRTIFAANSFAQNLAANPGKISQALTDQYNGESQFIRAITLFQLCNLYAQPYNFTADGSHLGVPIQLVAPDATGAFSPDQKLARSSVKDVYAQIEKDLLSAATLLPASSATPSFSTVARATKGAAEAMLMRLYLYKGDYANALIRANNVIGLNVFSLNAAPVTTFRAPYYTRESIFSVAMNTQDNPNTNNALGQHYSPTGRADITVAPYSALSILGATDLRRTTLLTTANAGNIYTTKYTAVSDWVPVVRYAEVLLTKAEILAIQNQSAATVNTDALALLNQVRTRSGATAYTAASFTGATAGADLLTAVRNERRLELAFEGHRLYDLFRYKQSVVHNGQTLPFGDNRLIFPIPLTETQINSNLVQNPGY